jgi:hypothetical protein
MSPVVCKICDRTKQIRRVAKTVYRVCMVCDRAADMVVRTGDR